MGVIFGEPNAQAGGLPLGYPVYPEYPAQSSISRAAVARFRAVVACLRASVARYRAPVERTTLFPGIISIPSFAKSADSLKNRLRSFLSFSPSRAIPQTA